MSALNPAATSAHGALDKALRPIENVAAIVGGLLMLSAMFLTSADAIMRYAFNAPIQFSYYLTERYLLVGLMTMPMAWGFRTGGYIRLTSILFLLPPLGRSLLLRAGLFVSALYVAVLAWLAGEHFWEVYERGDVQMGVIDWPLSWSWIWVPIGLGLLSMRLMIIVLQPGDVFVTEESHAVEDAV